MLQPAVRELATRCFERLVARGMTPSEVLTAFTPRRLCLVLRGLPEREPDRREELVGPPVAAAFDADGTPTRAARGFADRCGVAVEALRRVTTEKGEYVAAERDIAGASTPEVLAEILPATLRGLSWAKTMRWGSGSGPWVRPVHGLLALFDGEVVPCELFGVAASATTVGHPILSPEPFAVRGWSDYRQKLARRGLIVLFEARREALAEGLAKAAEELGGRRVEDEELLDKLTAICEVPGVVAGRFDESFLELPREVLVASLRDHQSAFTVEADGVLLPGFLTVMDRADDPRGRVRAGNEWVVEARLADARFFWREDLETPLAERLDRLEHLTFHAELGSFAEKTERVRRLTAVLAAALGWEDRGGAAEEAARLLKTDLTTEMVKEFTSLQGTVGGIYARDEGYPAEVWQAIYDQYLPVSVEDRIPRGAVGLLAALADRLDTLVGIVGLGLIPSGSRDPFGLRRVAQGLVRMVLEAELPLDLDLAGAKAVLLYGDRLERSGDAVLSDLRPFLHDRVRHLLGREGFAYDEIEAGLAVAAPLPDVRARVRALHAVRDEPAFLEVVLAAKRIANIVKDAPEHELDEKLLREEAEKALWRESRALRQEVIAAEAEGEYEKALRGIAGLAGHLERFFTDVLVMDEDRDLRHNRIALLQGIQRTLSRIARLTEMVVDKAELRRGGAEEA
jgi:glycyl-tRNA synthetase beta chain